MYDAWISPVTEARALRGRSDCLSRCDGVSASGRVYRETEVERTDFETIIADFLTGQFSDPIRVIAFNTPFHGGGGFHGGAAHFAGGGFRGGGFRGGGLGPAIAAGVVAGSVLGATSGYYGGGYGPGCYDNSYAYDNGYAAQNGFVCQPGTVFRGEDRRRHLCQ